MDRQHGRDMLPDSFPERMDSHLAHIDAQLARMEGKIDTLVAGIAAHGERLTKVETWREDHQRVDDDRVSRERWVIGILVAMSAIATSALFGVLIR